MNKGLLHIIQSPKNIGSSKNQFIWYTRNDKTNAEFKILQRDDGDWNALIGEVKDWLNNFIPPHALISISLYEDAHPNESKGINACIAHCAGSTLTDLAENEATKGPIYDVDVISGDREWDDMFNEATEKINKKSDEGHIISSTNDSSNDGGVVAIFSWSRDTEETLADIMRPDDHWCACSLF